MPGGKHSKMVITMRMIHNCISRKKTHVLMQPKDIQKGDSCGMLGQANFIVTAPFFVLASVCNEA